MKSGGPLHTFLQQSLLARIGFAIVCLLVLLALLAPWISPAEPARAKSGGAAARAVVLSLDGH